MNKYASDCCLTLNEQCFSYIMARTSYLCYFCLFAYGGVQYILTWRLSYKRQELLGLHEHLGSPLFLVGSVLLIFLVFWYVLFVFLCFVYPMLPVSLDCPFLIAFSVFSNVYLPSMKRWWCPLCTRPTLLLGFL
jgi:hypothetical protein